MKIKRNNKSMNKVEKLARKSLIKEIIIIYLILAIIIYILFSAVASTIGMEFFYYFNDILFGTLLLLLLSSFVLWPLRKKDHINFAYKKLKQDDSKKLVEENLIPLTPTKIAIINTRDGRYKDFILQLPDTETYAILGVNVNEISIYVEFIKSKKDVLLDIITKEEFTTYCKILDDNSKD